MSDHDQSPNLSDVQLDEIRTSDFKTITEEQRDLILKTKVENSFKSCCGTRIDKRLIVLSIQGTVSLSIMAFCFYQMSEGKNTDLTASLLSSTIAYWLARNENHES